MHRCIARMIEVPHKLPGSESKWCCSTGHYPQPYHTFEEWRKLSDALADVKANFYCLQQGKYMKLEFYHKLFHAQVEVINEVGITIPDESLTTSVAEGPGQAAANDNDHKETNQMALVIQFIHGTNLHHKAYLHHLGNSFLDGMDLYPSTIHETYNIL